MYTPKQTAKTIQRALSPQEQLSRDKLRRIILLGAMGGGSSAADAVPVAAILWDGDGSQVLYDDLSDTLWDA